MLVAVFATLAVIAIVSAIVVVLHRNPVFSTMSLVVTLVSTAGLFVLLGSPFLAALQILLYTGAILVLFLFVIMLLNVQRERTAVTRASGMVIAAGICAVVLAGAVIRLFWAAYSGATFAPQNPESSSLVTIARELFGAYILPFEMIGLLLLVAVVAASWVAQKGDPAKSDTPEAPDAPAAASSVASGGKS
ncbi:MAG: NADH-quinone oxidoreductase subunit J [Thermoanaerobaculia bacterium]